MNIMATFLDYTNRIRLFYSCLECIGVVIDRNELVIDALNGPPDPFDGMLSALDGIESI